jgi:hypothetical protein
MSGDKLKTCTIRDRGSDPRLLAARLVVPLMGGGGFEEERQFGVGQSRWSLCTPY